MINRSDQFIENETWSREPDLVALREGHRLLKTNANAGIAILEELADRGSAMSMTYIAFAYLKGSGIDRSDLEAERWFRRASETGSILAAHELAKLYLNQGKIDDAFALLSRGANAGYGPSLYRLGKLYLEGNATSTDLVRSQAMFEAAADRGNIFAKRALAMGLLTGKFGKRDIVRGLIIYLNAFPSAIKAAFENPNSDRLRS
ncbi:MAG: tetratricopeptide repeat protein [Methylovirgula sp.]